MATRLAKSAPRTPEQQAAFAKRQRAWRHNSFLGHCAMMLAQLQIILRSDTITPEARDAAEKALTKVDLLAFNLERRVD